MALFEQGDNTCYFIHIPRTGGRYVSSLFENSTNMKCKHHKINEDRFKGIDVTHLHYPLYNFFLDIDGIPKITVVRNPFERFNSCINNMHNKLGIDYNSLIKSYCSFLDYVYFEMLERNYNNNWFLPQHKFISPKTHYWKYEWGFGERFKKWVYKKTNIKIDLKKVEYENFDEETNKKYKLKKEIKGYVRKFYEEDYKTFKYFW